jgi:hypothetical protein
MLSYDEFLSIILPATNQHMRKYILYNKKKGDKSQRELGVRARYLLGRIFELEIDMALKR